MKKVRKTCAEGHSFYKSSDCNSCPICAQKHKPQDHFLSLLAAPARRALQQQNINSLEELSQYSEHDILGLHGIGKSSLPLLKTLLAELQLSFKSSEPKS